MEKIIRVPSPTPPYENGKFWKKISSIFLVQVVAWDLQKYILEVSLKNVHTIFNASYFVVENFERSGPFIFREIAFLAVLNFFPVPKSNLVNFEIAKKWNLAKKFFVKLIYLTSQIFFGLDFFKFSGPLCTYNSFVNNHGLKQRYYSITYLVF